MIDLRSDTVTKPTPAMRKAMADADVGDDVYGEDPTIRALEEEVAGVLGHEAAIFMPSGVMANQTAIKVHTSPGDEVIVEAGAHVLLYETGAAPVLSGVQLRPADGVRGVLSKEQIIGLVRGPNYHYPVTRLLCIENTHNKAGGTIIPLEIVREYRSVTRDHHVALHMDGARLWNACVATGHTPQAYAALADTVSVCFSKGLGAPVGSALAGSKELVTKSRKVRKMLGGGMRQAGILAAGALYALRHNRERLAEDHENARRFASVVREASWGSLDISAVQTNIVAAQVTRPNCTAADVVARAEQQGVLLSAMDRTTVRAVMHLDVSTADVDRAALVVRDLVL